MYDESEYQYSGESDIELDLDISESELSSSCDELEPYNFINEPPAAKLEVSTQIFGDVPGIGCRKSIV
ncbi:hypothetical protein NPIL_298811 [Nephila pilipes]|uniref:Uncharacterized protein n=1 Tax=Nephila pilipes TaxID=299642 RepID=A0A8X6QMA1_NEPPI|nr:hypothetical protein NPIL_298811 [Nephila pilipes]